LGGDGSGRRRDDSGAAAVVVAEAARGVEKSVSQWSEVRCQ